ncbi:MAG: hypothetical protein LBC92_01990, partial [Rickettsiales bacterium]|nr:hypothetical protein [Rickettsiales bacterium]
SRDGYECKHNINYWNSGEWVGIGAGAHSRININNKRFAIQNLKNPLEWIKKIKKNNNGISVKTKLDKDDIRSEKILMGLRTKYGIDITDVKLNNAVLLMKEKLIKIKNNRLSLTKNGFLLLNSIVEKLT